MAVKHRPGTSFREHILSIMDRKHHWAWPAFSGHTLTNEQLKIHFQQEYAVYVRDFPVFLARIHGQNPPAEVRRMLAENIYEEDTGGLSLGRSHPDLFLTMMEGLGYTRNEFDAIALLPASRLYRQWLDLVSSHRDWVIGAAALTIFVEGSINDRQEILTPSSAKTAADIEDTVRKHPLVQQRGLSPTHMDLVRAHQMVEAGHRHDAYHMIGHYAVEPTRQRTVIACLQQSLRLWLQYRDGVARACGVKKPGHRSMT
ncbi:MAG TPA: iron-containing redox enzyme family protein [Nitrospiraceae bacterium]|nr:iron-containing redox enzyme family protein [Nitrospiraceae bacterium]